LLADSDERLPLYFRDHREWLSIPNLLNLILDPCLGQVIATPTQILGAAATAETFAEWDYVLGAELFGARGRGAR
jgi:hypothetical protein